MTAPSKRTLRIEKLARIYDAEIGPCWGVRFGKLLLRDLAVPEHSQVLNVACGTGYPTIELLRRMTDGSRLIAIDESSAMLDVARRKVAELGPLGKRGVFFRTESAVPKLSFADEVYDLVVCNLGVGEAPRLPAALRDFARVAKPGGEVRCTLPLAGTFAELHDVYREVLVQHDMHEALERLDAHLASYPTFDQAEASLAAAELSGRVEVEDFALLFRSARELFFAPVIEYGPLAAWKAIAGDGQEMQDVFWYIKEAIDAYFGDRPFHVTVKAGCVIGHKAERTLHDRVIADAPHARDEAAARADHEPPTDRRLAPRRAAPIADPRADVLGDPITTPVPLAALAEEDAAFDAAQTAQPAPDPAAGAPWLSDRDLFTDDFSIDELASGDIAFIDDDELDLDAFVAGKKRPDHLAD